MPLWTQMKQENWSAKLMLYAKESGVIGFEPYKTKKSEEAWIYFNQYKKKEQECLSGFVTTQ